EAGALLDAATATATATADDAAHVTDEQLKMILDLSRMLAVPTKLDVMLREVARTCCDLLDCERSSIFLYDAETRQLWTKVALGTGEIRVPATAGIVGAAFSSNALVRVDDPYADPRFNPEPDRRTGFVTRNLLSAPMADLDGRPLGVIQAVNKRGQTFGETDAALVRLLSDQAGVALQRQRLQDQATEAAALRHEMDLARKTQQALIPKQPPNVPGLTACGWTLPASVTGGDCFDLWKLPDGRLGILVADASGHGLGPALIVSQARTLVRALSDLLTDPHEVLALVNARLADDLDWGHFVTAFLGFLSPDGVLHWSSAGHGPLLVRTRPDGPVETLDPPVQPLGVVHKWFDPPAGPVTLEPGGQLYIVSDGIFEACHDDAEGEQLGVERMLQIMDDHRAAEPQTLLAALRDAARDWYGKDEPQDDQTVVIVRRDVAG
ncbi:MAG TPA: GAF domain-containing SpoIIE family protein phosphatase, partial [Humisphaera sp.]